MPLGDAELTKRFTYHAPKGDQPDRYQRIRDAQRAFAEVLDQYAPDSREKSVAMDHLETAGFWANAAIARNE
jgi:hypothetical protein